jgi:hypothetical protein
MGSFPYKAEKESGIGYVFQHIMRVVSVNNSPTRRLFLESVASLKSVKLSSHVTMFISDCFVFCGVLF